MNDEPAFPKIGIESEASTDQKGRDYSHVYSYEEASGMTLRDYFASKAMQSFLVINKDLDFTYKMQSERAYLMADAMLAERAKGAKDE